MATDKTLLVVVDPTAEDSPAVERAVQLARAMDSKIELFCCIYDQYLSGDRFFDSAGLHKAREDLLQFELNKLDERARQIRDHGLHVSVDCRWDSPLHEGIVRKALESEPAILLKDTHYHNLLQRSLFTNTDWQLIRSCPCPLLLVKPGSYAKQPLIWAAVDPLHEHDKPAELDDRIIGIANELAAAVAGETHLVHAYNPVLPMAAGAAGAFVPSPLPVDELDAQMREQHASRLSELAADYDIPDWRQHVLPGPAQEVLVEESRKDRVDVVVMGAVARNVLSRIFLGSTAEKVMDRLPCDLLVVKPSWFKSPVERKKPATVADQAVPHVHFPKRQGGGPGAYLPF